MDGTCGIIEGMPARLETPELTGAAERGRSIFAGPARMAIMKALLDYGPATRAELVESTGMSHAGCRIALDQMEQDGQVSRSKGRPMKFAANRPQVVEDLQAVVGWMLSGPRSD